MRFFGNYELGSTVPVSFDTVNTSLASVDPSVDGTARVYKGDSTTQRSSSAGITYSVAFDGVTGCHLISIDTSDDTDPGFYETNKCYSVMVEGATIAAQARNLWAGSFCLGQLVGVSSTAVSTLSLVSIVNSALVSLGQMPITSLDETNKRAEIASTIYTSVRDSVLQDNAWTSSVEMAALGLISSTPLFGYAYQFQLPADCLRVLSGYPETAIYEINGRKLLTDDTAISIRYVKAMDDPTEMSPLLRQAISARLAFEMALSITGNEQIQKTMWELYRAKLSQAKANENAQNNPDNGTDFIGSRI